MTAIRPCRRTWSLALLLGLAGLGVADAASALTFTTVDRGWYRSDGLHTQDQQNTFTGRIGASRYRSFYVVDVSTGPALTLAHLEVELDLYYNGDATESIEIFSVLTADTAVMNGHAGGSASGQAIFADLGSGTSYGTFTFSAADLGVPTVVPLNGAAVADLNAARGGRIVFGIVHSSGNGGDQGLRFGSNAGWDGGDTTTVSVDEPHLALLVGLGGLLLAGGRRATPTGPGAPPGWRRVPR